VRDRLVKESDAFGSKAAAAAEADSALHRHDLMRGDGRCLFVYGELRGELPLGEQFAEWPAIEKRYDVINGGWVAVSPARQHRPDDTPAGASTCPLCPGGFEVPFSYDAAVFENRFPSFMPEPPAPVSHPLVAPALGRCEIVAYTEGHDGSLATLGDSQLDLVVSVWRDRSRDLWSDPRHAFILIFENRGEEVGATLSHPHGQIYAFDHVPPLIVARTAALAHHRLETGRCLSCDVVSSDIADRMRVLDEGSAFVVAVPFAPRWPYEIHLRARRHGVRRLTDLTAAECGEFRRLLQRIVRRYDGLFGFDLPYMMVIYEAPAGADDWHLSVEFMPPHRTETKLKIRASVETATGLFINDILPSEAAATLQAVPLGEGSVRAVSDGAGGAQRLRRV
jgi:UDPglucose--hexose-1-phosphate uridylyltransferase